MITLKIGICRKDYNILFRMQFLNMIDSLRGVDDIYIPNYEEPIPDNTEYYSISSNRIPSIYVPEKVLFLPGIFKDKDSDIIECITINMKHHHYFHDTLPVIYNSILYSTYRYNLSLNNKRLNNSYFHIELYDYELLLKDLLDIQYRYDVENSFKISGFLDLELFRSLIKQRRNI